MPNSRTTREGFTLIEMLVALAVFGLAAMALIKLATESTRHASAVERQALGNIIAERLATEISLGRPFSSSGESEMAGQVWRHAITPVIQRQGVTVMDVRVYTDTHLAARRLAYRTDGFGQ